MRTYVRTTSKMQQHEHRDYKHVGLKNLVRRQSRGCRYMLISPLRTCLRAPDAAVRGSLFMPACIGER